MNLSTTPFSRLSAKLFLSLVGLLAVIVLLLPTQIGVKTGLAIANKFVSVKYSGIQGSLYSTLQFNRFNIQHPGVQVSIEQLNIDLSLTKLFDLTAQLNSISAEKVIVTQTQKDTAEANSTTDSVAISPDNSLTNNTPSKAYIVSPIAIALGEVSVGYFIFNSTEQAQVSLSSLLISQLQLSDSTIIVDNASLATLSIYVNQDDKEPPMDINDWLNALKQAPKVALPDVFIPLHLKLNRIDIERVLQVALDQRTNTLASDTFLTADIENQVVALSINTFANVLLSGTQVKGNAEINLAERFDHLLNVDLAHNQQYLQGKLVGDFYNQNLVVTDGQYPIVNLNAESAIDADNLPLTASAEIFDIGSIFNFLNIAQPTVKITTLDLQLTGDWVLGYEVSSNGQLVYTEPTQNDESQLIAMLDGSLVVKPAEYELLINNYNISGELGNLLVNGQSSLLSEGTELIWKGQYLLNIDDLQLQKFHPALPDVLSGVFSVTGTLMENSAEGSLLCEEVKAVHNQKQLAMACDVSLSENGELAVNGLEASIGNNSVSSKGKFVLPSSAVWKYSDVWLSDIKTTIDFNVSAPDVSQILDDAAGVIESAATIQGNILTPNIKVTAHAGDLSYEKARLEQVDVSFTTNGETSWRSHLALSANNASFNKQEVKLTVITIDGDLDRQTISAEVNAENWRSEQRVTADLLDIDTLHWEGVWEKGMFQYEDYVLNKDSNTDFSFDIEQQHAKLAGHCWREPIAEAELCTKDLEFESNNVDIDTAMTINIGELLDVFRPDLFRPGSELLLKSTVNGTYSQKDGLNIKSGNLMQGSVLTTNHSLDISAIVANINATQDEIASVVFAGTQETGRVGLSSKLEFNGGAYQHAGRLSVDNLQLSLLRRFAPAVNQLQGKVNANVMFEGDLTQPGLFGEAIIEDGALTLDAYTYPLTQFMQSIVFDHKTASTNGGFRLGNGEAEFSADMNFDSALTVAGDIKGSGLEIAYKTYDLTTSPSINFSMTPELIDVDGKIVIDATDIKIDSLPESVRSPSSDVIVIGQKPPEPLLPIALDIKLQVLADPQEKETIQIDALGLKASLSGDLDLTVLQQPGSEKNTYQPMQTFLNGYLNVLSGSYDAWGQALQIQSGSVYFNGEPSLPEFDITAVRNPLNTQGDVVAGIKASGNPIIPKIELFSEPPMEQARQLSYLLRGQDLSGGSQADLNTQLINVLVGYGVGKNENRISRVGKALGFDSLNVQTAGQGDTTQVQVTGRIAEDLQITYAVGVFDAASEVILKYQLLPQLYIEATSGGLIHALDMFYEFSRGNMTSSDSETQ